VPELIEVHDAAKVRVFGPPAVLDGLTAPVDTILGRVAPDELVLLGRPGTGTELVGGLETALARHGRGRWSSTTPTAGAASRSSAMTSRRSSRA
jgi:hypothetical protein